MRKYWVAINAYRGEVSDGFVNTWDVYLVRGGRHQQAEILKNGLPVRDARHWDGSPVLSTCGVRPALRSERRAAERSGDYGII